MKKFASIVLVLLMVLALAACGSGGSETAAEEPAEEPSQEAAQAPAEVTDQALTAALIEQTQGEGRTLHITQIKNGEENYSYDYAILGEKYCADRIGGMQSSNGSYDVYRYVFDPNLYERPVLWTGVSDGKTIEVTSRSGDDCFLTGCTGDYTFGSMEYEGETYYYEEFPGHLYEMVRLLYQDGTLAYVVPVQDDGALYVNPSGNQIVRKITGIENSVDEALFDLPEGMMPVDYGH